MDKNTKIYVAGHHGLVGSAIWNNLQSRGYTNLVGRSHKELDLLDGVAVKQFSSLQECYIYLLNIYTHLQHLDMPAQPPF